MEHWVWAPSRVWGRWLKLAPRHPEQVGGPLLGKEVEGVCPSHQDECRIGEETQEFGQQVF